MKKIYLCLLAIVLFTGQVFAQSNYYSANDQNGRTVHYIKAGSSSNSYDKNQNPVTMSGNYGYMKFVIEGSNAWVYSYTGHGASGTFNIREDNSHWAITDPSYTGNIYIPSYISIGTSTKYPVVGIEHYAFHQLPLRGTITLDCSKLETIGVDAFSVKAKANSYTNVTIRTTQNLTIKENAFKNIFFDQTELLNSVLQTDTRQTYLGNKILDNRTCLQEVVIENTGNPGNITIEENAFAYCESLQKAEITSTNGNINIGNGAFACQNIVEKILVQRFGSGYSTSFTQPLTKMWTTRNTSDDYIKISGNSVSNIGNFAFAGHINIKRVEITATATTPSLTIGQQAFQNLFHGHGNGKDNWGVFIDAPISTISSFAFRHFYYSGGNGQAAGDTPPYAFEDCLNKVVITNTGSTALTINNQAFSDRFVQTANNTHPGEFILKGKIEKIQDYSARINDYTFNTSDKKSRLRKIEIDNSNSNAEMTIGVRAFENHMTSESPNTNGEIILNNVSKIDNYAFYKNEKAMSINITHNNSTYTQSIRNNAFEYNFRDTNANDGTLTITGKVDTISNYAFANGPGLKTVTMSNSSTPGLTIGQYAFYRSMGTVLNGNVMDETTELFKTGSVTLTGNLKAIGANAFNEMAGMKTFDLTSDTRFSIGPSAFENNFNFDDLKYTAGGTTKTDTLPDRVSWVGNRAFANTGFTQMTIPQLTLKYSDKASQGTGFKQASVNGVSVPASLDDHDVYNRNDLLSSQVFTECKKLTSVTIDNSATGQATFADCPLLETVNFGPNVKYIESGVFHRTPKLSFLTIPENVEVIGAAIKSNANDNLSYRIEFLAKQPPLAHINAFATRGESESEIAASGEGGRQAFVVVPWGSVSSYLFCSANRGFQNVTGDNISCAYKLNANRTWGSLGMQAHTIREYTGTFEGEGYMAPKLTVLDTTADSRSFTDVYDYRRVGITPEGSVATNGKSPASGDDAERKAVLDAIKANVDTLKNMTNGVFGSALTNAQWKQRGSYSKLMLIFKSYKHPTATSNGIQGDTATYKQKCRELWNDLKPELGSPYQEMSLDYFVDNFIKPNQIGPFASTQAIYNLSSTEKDVYSNLFYGAPTAKLLRLLLTDKYYNYFISGFIKNHDIWKSNNGNPGGYLISIPSRLDWNNRCDLRTCTEDDSTALVNLKNDYVTFVRDLNQQINQYYADYPIHIDWETDREFFTKVHEPFYVYTADTYYKQTGKVGIDLLTAGPIVPNSLTGQPWNNGYLVKGTAGQTYYLFHYIGEGSDGKAKSLGTKLGSGYYTYANYETLKNTTAHTKFKAGKTHCPTPWWTVSAANESDGLYQYNVYPNLLIAACDSSDIVSGHYLYGMVPGVTTGDQSVNFPMDYTLYDQDGGTGITKCRLYLLSNGAFARFRNWTQLSEGKSFLALPTQTMAGYDEGKPYVGATAAGSNDAKPEFFIHNNDFRFLVDLPEIIPTEIETIGYEDEEDGEDIRIVKGYWYTLDGSRLATPPTKKGIYIHNGKKIVVR